MDSLSRNILLNCKKCSAPLIMDFEVDLMIPPIDDDTSDGISDIIIPTTHSKDNPQTIEVPAYNLLDSLIDDKGAAANLSSKIRIANEIFKYMSGKSEIDHPMCQDCANTVIHNQELTLAQSQEELTTLESYLGSLEESRSTGKTKDDVTLKKLEEEEQNLLQELQRINMDNEQLDKDIEEEKMKLENSDLEYDRVVKEYNNRKQLLWDIEDDYRSLNQRKKYLSFLAERLKRTNVLNLLFPIWFEDHFATINGLRMGRLKEVAVEWSEINAGWGQCILLLQNVARKMEITFENYKLIPCGITSMIENLADKKKYRLYHPGGFGLLPNNNFDQAMVAYLDCLNQIMTRIASYDPAFQFPYRVIDKYKLEDSEGQTFSIKLSRNSNENWTKALKYMLIDLKWVKTWMVKSSYKTYCDSLVTKQHQSETQIDHL